MNGAMRMTMWLSLVLFITLQQDLVVGAPDTAKITSLPGFPLNSPFPSAHYGGYITISEESERALYYYFVRSESITAATDPVVLWLNGGPGCSSFDGFVYEHGPFSFEPAPSSSDLPTLSLNPYSWAKVANIIYLDSPAGVGFSYSKNHSDYVTGDLKTAADTYQFLLKWFVEYPEYQSNPFYIAGESWAGVYVPTLSRDVVNGNAAGVKPRLNFKGYAVGNGVTDEAYDGNAFVPFVHGMGLISDDQYQDAVTACGGNYWNRTTAACNKTIDDIFSDVAELNFYDILEPCFHDPAENSTKEDANSRLPTSFQRLGERKGAMRVRKRMFGRAFPLGLAHTAGPVPSWTKLQQTFEVPCVDGSVATQWLNSPSVREAIHAKSIEEIGQWALCTNKLKYFHDSGSMIPIHVDLTSRGYRALIYSGDHDMCVPFTGSEAWTRSLGYPIVDKWRPWFANSQVAGYTQGYAHNLTFATIKGSGHTVPEYKPLEALAFFSRWLRGKPL